MGKVKAVAVDGNELAKRIEGGMSVDEALMSFIPEGARKSAKIAGVEISDDEDLKDKLKSMGLDVEDRGTTFGEGIGMLGDMGISEESREALGDAIGSVIRDVAEKTGKEKHELLASLFTSIARTEIMENQSVDLNGEAAVLLVDVMNTTPEWSDLCATHAFFQATKAMEVGFKAIYGHTFDPENKSDVESINKAWAFGRDCGYSKYRVPTAAEAMDNTDSLK